MPPQISPGEVSPRVRALIVGACAVTVVIAALGMDSMWGLAEWIETSPLWGSGRSAFWYSNGLAFALAFAIALLWLPRFEVSRLLRVAVLLPLVHVVAIVVAAIAWSALRSDIVAVNGAHSWPVVSLPKVTLPSGIGLVIAGGAVLGIAIAIKRRHGEWAHASVMLTLSFLLLLGLWLPILSRLSVSSANAFKAAENLHYSNWDYYRYYLAWEANHRLLSRQVFDVLAIVPPAVIATLFTTIVFRHRRLFARLRHWPKTTVKLLLGGAILAALTLPDEGWLLYLESSYLVLFAVVLAIAALIMLTVVTRLGSLASHFSFNRLQRIEGVIARDEEHEVARFEITSWLRGPRLALRSFVVSTPFGSVPLDGVSILAPLPATTTRLDVGDHAPVFAPGDRVVIGGRKRRVAGDPFRGIDAAEVAVIAAPDARPYRFSDVTLVVWRPAVAYLAILIAVALPYLSIVLT